MSLATFRLGLRHSSAKSSHLTWTINHHSQHSLYSNSTISTKPISYLSKPCAKSPFTFSAPHIFARVTNLNLQRRHDSTLPSAIRTNPTQPSSATVLNWNSFFALRKTRRRYTLASSILSSLAVTAATFSFLSTQPDLAEEITKIIPVDPVIALGIPMVGAILLGWLLGPFFGNNVWKLFHRSRLPEFTLKEKTFFERIKKHRVNPMGASTNNPVPDFYGEKIDSVSGYRRWLRDQRAFNRKREGTYPGGI